VERLSVKYQLSYADFREGILAVSPRTRPWAWALLAVFMMIVAIAFGAMIFNPFHAEPPRSAKWIILTLMAIGLAGIAPAIWLYATGMSRTWSRNLQLHVPQELTIDDSTLALRWETSSVQTTWDRLTTWKETANTLVIGTNLGFFIVPKRQLSAFEFSGLITYLNTKAPPRTGGFPVELSARAH
jgi:hypothetical protein